MVEMGCAEHDQLAASTQFITHTVGRVLGTMDLQVCAPSSLMTASWQHNHRSLLIRGILLRCGDMCKLKTW